MDAMDSRPDKPTEIVRQAYKRLPAEPIAEVAVKRLNTAIRGFALDGSALPAKHTDRLKVKK